MGKKLTYEEVKDYIELQNYTLLSKKYENSSTPLEMMCEHGHIVNIRWNDFKNKGTRCHTCYNLSRQNKTSLGNINYYIDYIESFGYKVLSKEIINSNQKIEIKCPEGHIFFKSFNNFKVGQRCKICNRNLLLYDEVKCNIESTGYKLISTEYKNNRDKLEVECPNGHKYKVTYSNFQNGKRCKECASNSKGEDLISLFLDKNKITYLRQYRIDNCRNKNTLPFDFAIFDNNNNLSCLIEYQGIQHFHPIEYFGGIEVFEYTKTNDSIKSSYCKNNNIKLFLISYLDFNEIINIMDNIIQNIEKVS